jgi:hypothetical protein
MNDSQSKTAGSGDSLVIINNKPATAHSMLAALIDIYDDAQNNAPEHRCYVESAWGECLRDARALLATLSHPATQAGALQAVSDEQIMDAVRGFAADGGRWPSDWIAACRAVLALAATQPNAAPAAEVVAPRQGSFLMKRIDAAAEVLSEVMAFTKLGEPLATKVERALSGLRGMQANAAPGAAVEAREQEGAAKRLRAIVKLVGLEKAVPKDDATLWACAFTVLGTIRNALAAREPVMTMFRGGDPMFGKANIKVRWEAGANKLPDGEHKLYAALAAPGAAIDARERELIDQFSDSVHRQLHANERQIEHLCNELSSIARTAEPGGLHAAITKRVKQTITEAAKDRASCSEAPEARPNAAGQEQRLGYALAMRVLQSDLYHQLDERERAECDAFLPTRGIEAVGSSGMTADHAQGDKA